jgi:hypothetical protein
MITVHDAEETCINYLNLLWPPPSFAHVLGQLTVSLNLDFGVGPEHRYVDTTHISRVQRQCA